MYLQLSSHREGSWSVVHVAGELDIATAEQLRLQVTGVIARRGPRARVIADLSELTFCDACGASALVDAYNTARRHGGVFCLAVPEGRVRRLLRLTGLDLLLPVFPTVREAVFRSTATAPVPLATLLPVPLLPVPAPAPPATTPPIPPMPTAQPA
ncbi:STAS domain-containing protein [Kitasatospora sp. GP82]|uniref:STAS domain-containing protein n=1 Tax=Kitasatospora sp. GP82 TaxID=3035089 RepID=UPI0024743669|nr:STAS domain-containing protein [Kitasatospora sp. GP82]MDH6125667.1 anti-sigma B factor antagonist [Kitasatospora sp. GP82]